MKNESKKENNTMYKRVFGILCVCAIIVGLSACGKKDAPIVEIDVPEVVVEAKVG